MEITITETEKETDYTPCEKLVSVKASVDEGLTKVSSDNVGAFKWQSGDVITVVTDNNAIRQFSTNDSDLTADFSGMIPDTDNIGKYAMYPASVNHFALDDALLFHIDNIMTWRADASNMPMLGKISGSATFKAVGGALKLVLYNIPVDADTLLFSSTNKQISGEFEIEDATIAAPVIATAAKESKNNELKIDFSANYSASKVFYIPLPTGTIDGFTVSLLNEDGDELFSKTTTASLTVTANKLIIGPALNCSVALWEEDWTGYAKDDLPSSKDDREGLGGASITYTQTNGVGSSAGITKIYTEDSAGGSSPELLVGEKGTGTGAAGGTFTASGIPTDGETSMILIFKHKKTVGISLTDGITVAKTSFTSDGEESVVLTNTESLASFDITFTATTTDNVRLDDIKVIKGYSAPVITAPNTLTFSVGSTTKTGTVSISNSVDNLGISTVLSGDDYSWVSSVSISGTTLTVEATDINTTASARTATLTLKATGAASKAITITQPTALVSKPATISVVPGNASFSASWTKADHSTGYKAYLHTAETATPATGGTELTPSLDGSTYSVSRSGLTNGSTYYLYVKVNEVEENYVAEDAFKMVSFVPSNTIYYEKVTEDLDDWSGDYLIVWGSNAYYATDGTDFKTNAEVSISNGKIASTGHNSHKVTIEKVSTNYYIKLPSGKYYP